MVPKVLFANIWESQVRVKKPVSFHQSAMAFPMEFLMGKGETMMTIHFNADLHPIVKERVGMLHWVMDPLVAGFIIGYDLSGNQVLICNFDVSSELQGVLYDINIHEVGKASSRFLDRGTLPRSR